MFAWIFKVPIIGPAISRCISRAFPRDPDDSDGRGLFG